MSFVWGLSLFLFADYFGIHDKMKESIEHTTLFEKKGSYVYVSCLTCFASVGGFLIGYNLGIMSGALLLIKELFGLSVVWQEMLMGAPIATATFFSIIAGCIADRVGRKRVIMAGSFAFCLGSVLMAATDTDGNWGLLLGRIIIGIGIGK